MNLIETTKFDLMLDRVFKSVTVAPDKMSMVFEEGNGIKHEFSHDQDCCEYVVIEDICGNIENLVDAPMLQAEMASFDATGKHPDANESGTWTFYKFATSKGYVTVRWLGTSNGYYSESVSYHVRYGG